MKANKTRMIYVLVLMSMLLISVFAHPAAAFSDPTIEEYDERELEVEDVEPIEIDLDVGDKYNTVATIKSPSVDFSTTRERPIEINPDLLSSPKSFEGGSINLNLFENTTFSSNISNITEFTSGGTSIRLTLEGYDMAYSILSINNNIVNGLIEIPEKPRTFIIRWDSNSELHFVHEAEVLNQGVKTSQPENISNVDYNILEEELSDIELMYDPYQHITVDIMVLYTPAARSSAGGHNNIQSLIGTAVGTANTVFSNSGTRSSLNVVHKGEVSYTESGSLSNDRTTLRDRPDVQHLRNEHAADLVIFVTDLTINQVIDGPWGSARSLNSLNDGDGMPHYAHTAVVGCQFLVNPVSLYVFTHEVGHLFGCAHHRNDPQPGPRDWNDWEENDWTAAYHFSLLGIGYQTVMSRNSFTRVHIPFFSTPDEKFQKLLPVGNSNCNNARTIRTTKHIVSSYRNRLTIGTDGGGTVTTDPEPLEGSTNVFKRGDVTLTANPYNGWAFRFWWRQKFPPFIIPHFTSEYEIFLDTNKGVLAQFKPVHSPSIDGSTNSQGYPQINWNHLVTEDANSLTIHRYQIRRGNSIVATRYPHHANSNGDISFVDTNAEIGTNTYRVRTVVQNIGGETYSSPWSLPEYISYSGGGGGGGCPYVSVWNGEEYLHDNNLLVASEHQEGVVDDNYILQNTMEPKDGYYSLKIEEFEHSQDFFDTFSLYTIDHREGYSVGTTPEYEYMTYKDPVPPESAYDSYGQDILEYVSDPDNEPMYMPEGSSVVLNYGDMGNALWQHQKLVVRSHGFESYTEPSAQGTDPGLAWVNWNPIKTSLYVSLRVNQSDWVNVTVIHPRNHPSDIVIPLRDVLQEFVPCGIGEVEVQIVSTQNHYLDFVGLDNSVPTPVNIQEAPLVNAMLNGIEDVTDTLLEGNGVMVTIVPGEHIILTFEIPWQRPGRAFEVRDYMLFSRGYYQLYEGG